MGRLSRFQIMQHVAPKIITFFKKEGNKIYSISDIECILRDNRDLWTLSSITTVNDFISFLDNKNIIKQIQIKSPQKIIKKYIHGDVSDYEVALSLIKNSYCTHYTALFLHGLVDNIPKNIYINFEQIDKGLKNSKVLQQENIDRAFSRPMRETNQIALFGDQKIYLLNGKNVANIGVIDFTVNERVIKITNIERTLIDIVVRPNYAGGVQEILNSYIAAKGKCSINKLVSILKKMDYTYPYHQAIGFYLEKAEFDENQLKLVEKLPIKNNFYLTYQIKQTEYSNRWKLFFPKGF